MHYFYSPDIISDKATQFLPTEEAFHAFSVLRLSVGTHIIITNGQHQAYEAEITKIDRKGCQFSVIQSLPCNIPQHHLHLAVAPTKNMERFEWFLEKITEIGVHEITPVITEHSERTTLKRERCEKIIIAALKQSQKTCLPILHEVTTFKTWVEHQPSLPFQKYIAHCHATPKVSLQQLLCLEQPQNVLVFVGPEGDFSLSEVQMAESNSYQSVMLGSSRLRTETAALVAGHTAVLYWENR